MSFPSKFLSLYDSSIWAEYDIGQVNGQRIIVHKQWSPRPIPDKSCEIFIGKIPKDFSEYDIFRLFSTIGTIYRLRFMVTFSGHNRGYAFLHYTNENDALRAISTFNNYSVKNGWKIGVCRTADNCWLHVKIPSYNNNERSFVEFILNEENNIIKIHMRKDNMTIEGLVEYIDHISAALARKALVEKNSGFMLMQKTVEWAQKDDVNQLNSYDIVALSTPEGILIRTKGTNEKFDVPMIYTTPSHYNRNQDIIPIRSQHVAYLPHIIPLNSRPIQNRSGTASNNKIMETPRAIRSIDQRPLRIQRNDQSVQVSIPKSNEENAMALLYALLKNDDEEVEPLSGTSSGFVDGANASSQSSNGSSNEIVKNLNKFDMERIRSDDQLLCVNSANSFRNERALNGNPILNGDSVLNGNRNMNNNSILFNFNNPGVNILEDKLTEFHPFRGDAIPTSARSNLNEFGSNNMNFGSADNRGDENMSVDRKPIGFERYKALSFETTSSTATSSNAVSDSSSFNNSMYPDASTSNASAFREASSSNASVFPNASSTNTSVYPNASVSNISDQYFSYNFSYLNNRPNDNNSN